MKSRLLLMLCVFCATMSNYAQSSASQSGIAVQGIARDVNNTALTNQTINLTFTLYYLDASSIEQPIYKITKNLDTDAFGVFSDVIDPTAINNSLFANNIAYLKIEKGSDVISDEKLRHVPYAVSANNGVPTGSIMPFMGTVAPTGWYMCDGRALPSTATDLIAMVGNNAPDLRGLFLRGTGITKVNNQSGPALKSTQLDEFKGHTHGTTNLKTNTTGNHNHNNESFDRILKLDNKDTSGDIDDTVGEPNVQASAIMKDAGNHFHTITGDVDNTGGNETRPANYGVNYIIKL